VAGGALADFYFLDPRVVLVPIEHLTDGGMSGEMAELVALRAGWAAERIALFDAGWRLYWERGGDLARRTRTWPGPRRRHVAVAGQAEAVRPYVSLLNTSAWLVYESDVDPETSHPEFLAYVLALGDRMALGGEVATAAVRGAAWWLERSDEECAAFATAAACSTRPDAAAYVAVGDALPWLRRLHHETLRPPSPGAARPAEPIPGSGLLVPAALHDEPLRLIDAWTRIASRTLAAHRAHWRRSDPGLVADLCGWLAAEAPPLLVIARGGRIVWDPEAPGRVGGLRAVLKTADAAAVERVQHDLQRISEITRGFLAAVRDPAGLPAPAPGGLQRGYTYLHEARRLVAYDLHEAGMERLLGPALPYEHPMVAARTAHEWAHLADVAGWVPRVVAPDAWAALRAELAAALDDAVAHASSAVRARTAADLAELAEGRPVGVALGRVLVTRMPDYRANLVARRLTSDDEAETYVRHNVRALGADHPPERAWRLLLRYLFEYQYLLPALGMTRVPDPRTFLVASTGIADEIFRAGVVDEERFDDLAAIVARLCGSHAVDPAKLRFA
jgi:hypothetical protein